MTFGSSFSKKVYCIHHCIHIHWCIPMGLGHNDPWVESHMWPRQMWGQRSSRGQWPLIIFFFFFLRKRSLYPHTLFPWKLHTMTLGRLAHGHHINTFPNQLFLYLLFSGFLSPGSVSCTSGLQRYDPYKSYPHQLQTTFYTLLISTTHTLQLNAQKYTVTLIDVALLFCLAWERLCDHWFCT